MKEFLTSTLGIFTVLLLSFVVLGFTIFFLATYPLIGGIILILIALGALLYLASALSEILRNP